LCDLKCVRRNITCICGYDQHFTTQLVSISGRKNHKNHRNHRNYDRFVRRRHLQYADLTLIRSSHRRRGCCRRQVKVLFYRKNIYLSESLLLLSTLCLRVREEWKFSIYTSHLIHWNSMTYESIYTSEWRCFFSYEL
jgi:hypothetical protein